MEINQSVIVEIEGVNMSGSQTVTCMFCSKEFKRPKKLRNHIRNVHKLDSCSRKEQQNFKCEVCGNELATTEIYLRHIMTAHTLEEEKELTILDKIIRRIKKAESKHAVIEVIKNSLGKDIAETIEESTNNRQLQHVVLEVVKINLGEDIAKAIEESIKKFDEDNLAADEGKQEEQKNRMLKHRLGWKDMS